jgi:NitT/TauT family transport system substrate-binding protein
MQMLLAGKADAAVLTEPVATAAQIQGKAKGVRVAVNLQQEWGRLTGRAPRFPQVGTIAMTAVIKEHPEVIAAIQTGLIDAVSWARLNPKDAAALGEQTLTDLKAPVIEQSLTRTPLDVVPAAQAKDELAFFFQALKELSPEIIGGDLPDSGFYYGGN